MVDLMMCSVRRWHSFRKSLRSLFTSTRSSTVVNSSRSEALPFASCAFESCLRAVAFCSVPLRDVTVGVSTGEQIHAHAVTSRQPSGALEKVRPGQRSECAPSRSSRPRGWHHEIYRRDPPTSAPENLRTILHQPIEPLGDPVAPSHVASHPSASRRSPVVHFPQGSRLSASPRYALIARRHPVAGFRGADGPMVNTIGEGDHNCDPTDRCAGRGSPPPP